MVDVRKKSCGLLIAPLLLVLPLLLTTASNASLHEETLSAFERMAQNRRVAHEMRRLIGSAPPRCFKRCGGCNPCSSVLVPIHQNLDALSRPRGEAEYYPVAWRCQCRGKIYYP
ncbi:hypothetical protein KP509_17G038100 [Ceratopteris richardii]|uniref:Epidermal patterning factor-like protein n=1 Tax=Ceratopteris richardii TaxID=49495 RepID=A0A8T2SV60_CERRI|nr:hypothetical protein KP509_17G038100 [Ceratopteris richardii]